MALWALTRALGSLSLAPPAVTAPGSSILPAAQVIRLTRERGCFGLGRGREGCWGWEAGDAGKSGQE